MYKYPVELVTMTDARHFNQVVSTLSGKICLTDGQGYRVNAKSLLGNLAALEWKTLYCESENDIYRYIGKFCKGSQ